MDAARHKIAFYASIAFVAGLLSSCAQPALISGFKPISPIQETTIDKPKVGWPEVDSLQPTLAWEPFPGVDERPAGDFKDIPRKTQPQSGPIGLTSYLKWPFVEVDMRKVSNITYELRIWEVQNDSRGPLVYQRRDIPKPSHTIETKLKPESRYLWTVRAHFLLDGHPRVTGWSMLANVQILPTNAYPEECRNYFSGYECTVQYAVRLWGDIPAAFLYRFQTP